MRSGTTLLVGAPYKNNGRGAIYIEDLGAGCSADDAGTNDGQRAD